MIAPLFLALALAGPPEAAAPPPATPAAPADGTTAESPTPPSAPPAAAPPASAPPPPPAGVAVTASATIPRELAHPAAPAYSLRGWRHALALGAQGNALTSKEGSAYAFRSASIGYLGSVGSRGLYVQASWLVPLRASQDGASYATGDYYRRREGGDLLVGFNWRWSLPHGLEAEGGPGLHGTFIFLPGKDNYRDFTAAPLGLGAAGALSWDTGWRQLGRAVTAGGYFGAAYDLRDPAHANDLARGWMLRVGLTLGLGGRT
jgi:hypothetical protein